MARDSSRRSPEELAKEIFGERAAFYVTSAAHRDPAILARVTALAAPRSDWRALDVATAAGHTAFALARHVRSVVAVDLTLPVLREAERLCAAHGLDNVAFGLADVHRLPFGTARFDLVTCRRAAHHFSDIGAALGEMRRVLRPGGRVVIDDRSVPDDDFVDWCMNTLDRWHDPSHVRQYRAGEWRALLARAGFAVEAVYEYTQHRPVTALTDGVAPGDVARIEELLRGLDASQRAAMRYGDVGGQPYLNHWYVMVAARAVG